LRESAQHERHEINNVTSSSQASYEGKNLSVILERSAYPFTPEILAIRLFITAPAWEYDGHPFPFEE
jgi:hypothetical protein